MTATLDREVVAQRLLGGSIRRSYQPEVDIDWDAPIDPHKYFLPPQVVSLYGTPYWEEMTEAQRIELSRQEMANVLSVGIWFENLLNRALLRELMHEDHRSAHVHYALTEMGDECRHMTMFGKVIDRVGARPYQMRTARAGRHGRAAVRPARLAAVGRRARRRGDLRLASSAA